MNNTTKAKYDAATRMLKGHIDVEEVAMMIDIPIEELRKIAEQFEENNAEVKTIQDLDMGPILYENFDDLDTSDGSDS